MEAVHSSRGKKVGNKLYIQCELSAPLTAFLKIDRAVQQKEGGSSPQMNHGSTSLFNSSVHHKKNSTAPQERELNIQVSKTKPVCRYNFKTKPFETNWNSTEFGGTVCLSTMNCSIFSFYSWTWGIWFCVWNSGPQVHCLYPSLFLILLLPK